MERSIWLVKRVNCDGDGDENVGIIAVRVMVTEPAPVLIAPLSVIVLIA